VLRRFLSILLISLIAVQSVVAVADAHKGHQSKNEHREFDQTHDHELITPNGQVQSESTVVDNTSDVQKYDCHHCCHCHGVAQLFVADNSQVLGINQSTSHHPSYSLAYPAAIISPNLRPPIL